MLCQLAESGIRHSSLSVSVDTLKNARLALDRIRQEFSDASTLLVCDATEIQRGITALESKLVRLSQRLRGAMEAAKSLLNG